jgi:hypothetical protein
MRCTLAFPLLAKLSEVGDPVAQSVFKEEIAKRLESGCRSVIDFLYEQDYVFRYLSKEEFFHALLVPEEAEILLELESLLNIRFYQRWEYCEPNTFIMKDRHVCVINLSYSEMEEIPEVLFNLKSLERLESHY